MRKFSILKLLATCSLAISTWGLSTSSDAYEMPGIAYFEVPANFNLVQIYQQYHKHESIILGKDLNNLDQNNLNKYFPFKFDNSNLCQQSKSIKNDNFIIESDNCSFPENLENKLVFQSKDGFARLEVITFGTGDISSDLINSSINFIFNHSFIRNRIIDIIKQSQFKFDYQGHQTKFGKLEDVKTGLLNGEKVFVFVFKNLDSKYKAYPHAYTMLRFNDNYVNIVSSFAKTKELANSNLVYTLNHFRYDDHH